MSTVLNHQQTKKPFSLNFVRLQKSYLKSAEKSVKVNMKDERACGKAVVQYVFLPIVSYTLNRCFRYISATQRPHPFLSGWPICIERAEKCLAWESMQRRKRKEMRDGWESGRTT